MLPIEITQPGDLHQVFRRSRRRSLCERLTWFRKSFPLTFITSRRAKFDEVATLLAGWPLVQQDIPIPTLEKVHNLPLVAAYRVLKAFKKVQGPVLLEETSLDIVSEGKEGFPGRHFKEVVELGMGKERFAQHYQGQRAKLTSVFAYTGDGYTAHIFQHQAMGTIVHPQVWIDGDGSDPLFQLDGYEVPLSHLQASAKHFIYVRQFPIAELRSMLENASSQYAGVYELHVTVANHADETGNPLRPQPDYAERFRTVCQQLHVKPIVIRMAHPNQQPDQLQTAAYVVCPNGYTEAQERIFQLSQALIREGFPVLRNRIEAMLHNRDSPKTDAEAARRPKGNYFEFHAKLEENADQVQVRGVIATWDGSLRLSMSFVKGHIFVNAKGYAMGAQRVLAEWNRLLQQLPYRVCKEIKPEYCVYDDNPHLDESLVL